jgi:hypothetical protein
MKVDYNLENMLKCICCKCEIQTYSKCAKDRTERIQKKIEEKSLEAIPVFKPKEFPWLYPNVGEYPTREGGDESERNI